MLEVIMMPTNVLKAYANNARTHGKKQIAQIARSIKEFGFINPIVIDESNTVMAGHGRLAAAEQLSLTHIPTIQVGHLSEQQKRSYILADNKLAEKAGWDKNLIKIELEELLKVDIDFDLTKTGFETPEIDIILNGPVITENDPRDVFPDMAAVSKQVNKSDLWQLGEHWLFCGDSLDAKSFETLLGDKKADLVFTDPPYNVAIDGHVCGNGAIKHQEFAYASGEMSEAQFIEFLNKTFLHLIRFSHAGSIHYVCMDWRHVLEITTAGKAYTELKNICVWNKQVGGMGSLYRSQHELVFVFKNGEAPHINNIELGKHGRYRTNIWDYGGISSAGKRQELKLHPTVKPVQMIADAIVDCSAQGALILDCFGGSGSTLLAAEKTGRKAYLIEYEPHYCDVILYRYEKMTGITPVRVGDGNE